MTRTNGTVLAISTVTLGDVLAGDVTAGATTITVDDAADFAETGGTVLIGGQLVDYSSVVDETGVMVLVDPLAAGGADGDPVNLAGPDGSIAKELRALVAPVGGIDSDDAIEASVAYPLVPLLPEGIRDPGTGESVTLTLQGTEWQLTNVHGREPDLQSDNLAGGIPSGGGGGPLGSVFYSDSTGGSATSFWLDPSGLTASEGDVSVFSYDGTDPGIMVAAGDPGWYTAQCGITFGALTQPVSLHFNSASAGYSPGNATVHAPAGVSSGVLTATLAAFYLDGLHNKWFDAEVFNPGGATIDGGYIYVVKLV